MADDTVFLGLEFEDGSMIFEKAKNITQEEINAALEDAPVVYIFQAYQDDGLQPATHLDPIEVIKREV